jgi:hypothetical protein
MDLFVASSNYKTCFEKDVILSNNIENFDLTVVFSKLKITTRNPNQLKLKKYNLINKRKSNYCNESKSEKFSLIFPLSHNVKFKRIAKD